MSETSKRLLWVDVLRIVGCLCVLITHVEYNGGQGGRELMSLIDFYGIAGFLRCFMVSGLFAFLRHDRWVRSFVQRFDALSFRQWCGASFICWQMRLLVALIG